MTVSAHLWTAAAPDVAALQAQVDALAEATSYAQSSFLLLISGMVVMFMAAGFCMLETGLVRQKNAATIALKNVAIYALAGLAYLFIGFNLMYRDGGSNFFGLPGLWSPGPMDEINGDYASGADWFFQMAFVATAASIVSGTLAERIKLWPFLVFTVVLTAVIYPIQGYWDWGAGWLDDLGFSDFAGSTIVHSCGGWAALTGALFLGAREGKFGADGRIHPMPGSNLPLAALGTFILWFGWFGFNGGSQLAFGTPGDVNAVAKILANTNVAAAGGMVTAAILTQLLYKKVDLTLALNGAIGGLVAITAEPLTPAPWLAVVIGAVGGVIVVFGVPLLDRLKIDDVVGAIPAHLMCGIWGTFAVPISNPEASFPVQVLGIVSIGLFVSGVSSLVWWAMKATVGIRVSPEHQLDGLDKVECGLEAYPEFAKH